MLAKRDGNLRGFLLCHQINLFGLGGELGRVDRGGDYGDKKEGGSMHITNLVRTIWLVLLRGTRKAVFKVALIESNWSTPDLSRYRKSGSYYH